MNSLACTIKSLAATSTLNCSLPGASLWHYALPILGALIGALLGACALVFGQSLMAKRQATMQERRIAAVASSKLLFCYKDERYFNVIGRGAVERSKSNSNTSLL
jgi:hypothetical protein